MPADRRVLVIDDEDDIREVIELSLDVTEGWTVLSANSGPSGILLAQLMTPDVILLDVMMPDMDGPSTLKLLQRFHGTAAIPVIFLTAKVHSADHHDLMKMGVRGIISKPFDPITIGGQIRKLLDWS